MISSYSLFSGIDEAREDRCRFFGLIRYQIEEAAPHEQEPAAWVRKIRGADHCLPLISASGCRGGFERHILTTKPLRIGSEVADVCRLPFELHRSSTGKTWQTIFRFHRIYWNQRCVVESHSHTPEGSLSFCSCSCLCFCFCMAVVNQMLRHGLT